MLRTTQIASLCRRRVFSGAEDTFEKEERSKKEVLCSPVNVVMRASLSAPSTAHISSAKSVMTLIEDDNRDSSGMLFVSVAGKL